MSYVLGAHVYRVPNEDLDAVVADMATMKKMGFTLANIQTHWSWDNPKPNTFDFAETDRLVAAAKEIGLEVALTLTLEQVPMWAWRKHPDAFMLNAWNEPYLDPTQYTIPFDGKPGPCWDHAGIRADATRYLKAYVKHFARQSHIAYYNIWQEIGIWSNRPGDGGVQSLTPYNPETLAKYRAWLKQKYGTIGALNKAWRVRYGDWSEVDPPRMHTFVPAFPDWGRYIHEGYMAGAAKWKADVIRAADPKKRPIAFHVAFPLNPFPAEHVWSRCAESYGTSYYPTVMRDDWELPHPFDVPTHRAYELWTGLFQMAYSRDACERGRRFMMHELAAGPYNNESMVRGPVSEADMRQWLAMQLAVGSTGTILWNTRPEHFWAEAQGQGFLDGRGNETERCKAIRALGAAAEKYGDLLATAARPVSPVAIGLDDDSARIAQGSAIEKLLSVSLRGTYKAALPFDPDFIDLRTADLSGRKVVILPFPLAVSADTLAKLTRFAEAGGTVILGPTPARFDPYGTATPTMMPDAVADLLGVAHLSLRNVAEVNGTNRWAPRDSRPGDILPATRLTGTGVLKGLRPTAAFYLHTVTPTTAAVLARAGKDAVVTERALGAGRVVFVGTLFGLAAAAEGCADSAAMLRRVIERAGADADEQGGVVRFCRGAEGGEVWSLLNLSGRPAAYRIDSPAWDLQAARLLRRGAAVRLAPSEARQLIVPA